MPIVFASENAQLYSPLFEAASCAQFFGAAVAGDASVPNPGGMDSRHQDPSALRKGTGLLTTVSIRFSSNPASPTHKPQHEDTYHDCGDGPGIKFELSEQILSYRKP